MIGEAYVSLRNGPMSNPELDWSAPIHGNPSSQLGDLVEKVNMALSRTDELVDIVKTTLETTQTELQATAQAIRDMTQGTTRNVDIFVTRLDPLIARTTHLVDVVEKRLPTLLDQSEQTITRANSLLTDAGGDVKALTNESRAWLSQTRQDSDRLLKEVSETVTEARNVLTTVSDEAKQIRADLSRTANTTTGAVSDGQTKLNDTLARLDTSIHNANSLIERLDDITAKIQKGEGTVGALVAREDTLVPKLNSTLDEANTTLRRLNTVSKSVEEFTTPKPGRNFADIGFELTYRGATDSLQSELALLLRPNSTQSLLGGVANRSGKQLYNIMFGERFGAVTGRVGFIESQGALGLDWGPTPWLTVRGEAIGLSRTLFTQEETLWPRLDAKLIFRPFPRANVVIGAENLAKEDAGLIFGLRTQY
jgi:ABC-type transporter Mla subunit MlaD